MLSFKKLNGEKNFFLPLRQRPSLRTESYIMNAWNAIQYLVSALRQKRPSLISNRFYNLLVSEYRKNDEICRFLSWLTPICSNSYETSRPKASRGQRYPCPALSNYSKTRCRPDSGPKRGRCPVEQSGEIPSVCPLMAGQGYRWPLDAFGRLVYFST